MGSCYETYIGAALNQVICKLVPGTVSFFHLLSESFAIVYIAAVKGLYLHVIVPFS